MHLTHPEFLLISGLLVIPYPVRPRRAWQYASVQLLPAQAGVGLTTLLTATLVGSAFLLLLVALANPQRTTAHSTEIKQARDIVRSLLLELRGNRVGLVTFAGKTSSLPSLSPRTEGL